jgi:hypothetical protein
MPKKIIPLADWISAHDAAQLLSLNMGRPIPSRYVVKLSRRRENPVRTQPMGNRLLYHRDDILSSTVKQKASCNPAS